MKTTTSDIRDQLLAEASRGVPDDEMVELIGASFIADEPSIFGQLNESYIKREIDWYETRLPNIGAMQPPVPKIWQQVAGELGQVNSHYGHLVYSSGNGWQYSHVVSELSANPASRRAVMIYTRPSMHVDAVRDGMDDFVCTNVVQYLLRSGSLDAVVQMRSNDAVFGYRNDLAWQRHVLARLSGDLGVEQGVIHWQVGSLHVYPRHRHLLDHYAETGEWDVPLSASAS